MMRASYFFFAQGCLYIEYQHPITNTLTGVAFLLRSKSIFM